MVARTTQPNIPRVVRLLRLGSPRSAQAFYTSERMLFLLLALPFELTGIVEDCKDTSILQVDPTRQTSMPATTSHRRDSPSVEGCDDMVDAVVDPLNPSVERHLDLVLDRSGPSG